jgi:hypothetical protein
MTARSPHPDDRPDPVRATPVPCGNASRSSAAHPPRDQLPSAGAASCLHGKSSVPDVFFDQWLGVLTGAEYKVLTYLCRRTFGFRRDSAGISAAQIAAGLRTRDGRVLDRGTNIHLTTVREALRRLVKRGLVQRQPQFAANGAQMPNRYSVNIIPVSEGDGGPAVTRRRCHHPDRCAPRTLPSAAPEGRGTRAALLCEPVPPRGAEGVKG